jgi:putative ABC transport system permease protein
MVRGEAMLIAVLAMLTGVSLGVALGAGAVGLLGANADAHVVVPLGRLALIVAVAVGAGLVAGVLPARRAARLDVLTAIAES